MLKFFVYLRYHERNVHVLHSQPLYLPLYALIQTRLWIASIAFSLLFGTIFVKTWRVYYIFYSDNRHKKGKKRVGGCWNDLHDSV